MKIAYKRKKKSPTFIWTCISFLFYSDLLKTILQKFATMHNLFLKAPSRIHVYGEPLPDDHTHFLQIQSIFHDENSI
jgi:hypothetical protein